MNRTLQRVARQDLEKDGSGPPCLRFVVTGVNPRSCLDGTLVDADDEASRDLAVVHTTDCHSKHNVRAGIHLSLSLLSHLVISCTLASSANRSSVARSCVRAFLIDTASRSRWTFDRRSSSPGACRSANITDFAYSSASLPVRPNALATHLPNSRFRRAFSLNRNSCSSRNFSSDPFFDHPIWP